MGSQPTPEQRKAMNRLDAALKGMRARGLGSDCIGVVLEGNFPGICNEMAGGASDHHWHLTTDPYFLARPAGRIRAAELAMESATDQRKK